MQIRINCGNASFAATRGNSIGGDFGPRNCAVVWLGRNWRSAGDESRGGHFAAGDAAVFLREPAVSGGARGPGGGKRGEKRDGAPHGFHSAGSLRAVSLLC